MQWLNPPQLSCNFTRWFFGVFFHSPDDIFNDTLPSESRSTKYNQIKWSFCSVDHSECRLIYFLEVIEKSRCNKNSNYRLTCLLVTDVRITEWDLSWLSFISLGYKQLYGAKTRLWSAAAKFSSKGYWKQKCWCEAIIVIKMTARVIY